MKTRLQGNPLMLGLSITPHHTDAGQRSHSHGYAVAGTEEVVGI